MANLGLSAKQEKDDRLQKTKQEVAEMVKQRLQYMKSKVEEGKIIKQQHQLGSCSSCMPWELKDHRTHLVRDSSRAVVFMKPNSGASCLYNGLHMRFN
ncbi:hypothetical protein ACS0TY_008349 [Phlomoides rotata]